MPFRRQIADHPTSVIQDRSVYEDAEVFARNLFLQGHFSERDYATYRNLYQSVMEFLPPPDVIVYLRASVRTLLDRIARRGRDFETTIAPEYLAQLNELYEQWITSFRVCPTLVVSADELDFVAHPGHLDLITQAVNEKLDGNRP
jgi:deoxyadenosine/deoxycytidine kinase